MKNALSQLSAFVQFVEQLIFLLHTQFRYHLNKIYKVYFNTSVKRFQIS